MREFGGLRLAYGLLTVAPMRSPIAPLLALLTACAPATRPLANPVPAPAIPAILGAFDRYDVVALNAGHGMKEVDDLLLELVRDPRFPDQVNDIAIECGNSLYQPILDQYISGGNVPFADVRKVWRNTTQEMCGFSSFFEQLIPLVRAINQQLPAARRLRVLAGDPPIDWEKVETSDEAGQFFRRDPSIAAIMTNEVLAKHRKALMLFGTFHLMHGTLPDPADAQRSAPPSAVSIYEKAYPGRTFVIADLGIYDTRQVAQWPNPSLVLTRGTTLGALSLKDVSAAPVSMRDCKATLDFPPNLRQPMAVLVDAFLYLGPQALAMKEPIPADVALDAAYLAELSRREGLVAPPGAPAESAAQLADDIAQEAQQPIRERPPVPDVKLVEQACRARQQPRN